MTDPKHVIGADIGGTHITAGVVDLQQKQLIHSTLARAPINANGQAQEVITAWSHCIALARQNRDIANVCVAMPGPFDYEVGISLMKGQNKYESLYELNVKHLLAHSLQLAPKDIFMDNDAACFLHGEVFGGAAKGYVNDTVVGITLGTGLGSAIYRNGKSQNADLWRHPFKDGMAEDYLSTRWFVNRFEQCTGKRVKGGKELAELAHGDGTALMIFREFGDHLGQFLLDFIKMENPKAIVIGGNISKATGLFGDLVRQKIHAQYPHIKIEQALLGEEAPLLGAAGSWLFHRKK